jgi:hypothetical protein
MTWQKKILESLMKAKGYITYQELVCLFCVVLKQNIWKKNYEHIQKTTTPCYKPILYI